MMAYGTAKMDAKRVRYAEFPTKWLAQTNILFRVPKLSNGAVFLKKTIDKSCSIVYDITGLEKANLSQNSVG